MEEIKPILSKREREVLSLLVEGNSYKGIAALCCISFFTVNTHLKNIYKKIGVNTATGAVTKALRQQLL
jgi:DNA-binding CsgD family transcriptional regulator